MSPAIDRATSKNLTVESVTAATSRLRLRNQASSASSFDVSGTQERGAGSSKRRRVEGEDPKDHVERMHREPEVILVDD
jgi:hypothetical protein